MSGTVVCLICGREGTRGFIILSGDPWKHAGSVSYRCINRAACKRRELREERKQNETVRGTDRGRIRHSPHCP